MSLPIFPFIDGFGAYRNSYCSLKAYYAIPASLSYGERRDVNNVFMLTIGSQGSAIYDLPIGLVFSSIRPS